MRTLVHLHFSLHAGGQVRDVYFSSCNASQVMHWVNGASSGGGDEERRRHISAMDRFLLCVPLCVLCVSVCVFILELSSPWLSLLWRLKKEMAEPPKCYNPVWGRELMCGAKVWIEVQLKMCLFGVRLTNSYYVWGNAYVDGTGNAMIIFSLFEKRLDCCAPAHPDCVQPALLLTPVDEKLPCFLLLPPLGQQCNPLRKILLMWLFSDAALGKQYV